VRHVGDEVRRGRHTGDTAARRRPRASGFRFSATRGRWDDAQGHTGDGEPL